MIVTFIAALAAQAAPSCPASVTYPPALAGWPNGAAIKQGIAIGQPSDVAARSLAEVRLTAQPSRPLTGSHVATAPFEVKAAGRYAVAAGGVKSPVRPLWLDIADARGKPLASAGHGHGPACTSITKIVEFDLKPGRYTLLASGLTSAETVRVLITRKR